MKRPIATSPSHQFPTGATMSLGRRLELLDWARQAGAWILEEDYDSEYRLRGRLLEALQGLDQAGRVLYIGTFSKVLFPALRLYASKMIMRPGRVTEEHFDPWLEQTDSQYAARPLPESGPGPENAAPHPRAAVQTCCGDDYASQPVGRHARATQCG